MHLELLDEAGPQLFLYAGSVFIKSAEVLQFSKKIPSNLKLDAAKEGMALRRLNG
jgi:hypothetical protein